MTNARNLALAALAAALLAGCNSVQEDAPPPVKSETSQPAAKPAAPEVATKLVNLPFRVDITYSDAARARLRETYAHIGVSADYYGVPKDPAAEDLDPELGVWLGGEMEVLKDGRTSVTMKGEINAARVAREVSGDARVRVLAFPVRGPAEANDITCEAFDEALPIAVETGAVVHCTLKGK